MQHITNIIILCLTSVISYSQNPEKIDFAIENIASVNKIVIIENNGRAFTLIKDDNLWSDDNGNCVVQESVGFILDAFEKIEFKGYLPENTIEHYSKRDSISRFKVEIYQNSVCTKIWYIGPPSHDHNGQIMYLKSKDSNGKTPVLTRVRGLVGIIEPRFFTDPLMWECTEVFKITPKELAWIRVTNNEDSTKSFSVYQNQDGIKVFQGTNELKVSDKASIYRYIDKYKKIHYDRPNYQPSKLQIDSLEKTIPFIVLEVMNQNGYSKIVKCYRKIKSHSIDVDENRFWCILPPEHDLVECQYHVFNSLFNGELYFPLSNSNGE